MKKIGWILFMALTLLQAKEVEHIKEYYSTGELAREVDKLGEMDHGKKVTYYKNGQIKSIGYFEYDYPVKESYSYYEDGSPKGEEKFGKGGLRKRWREDGTLEYHIESDYKGVEGLFYWKELYENSNVVRRHKEELHGKLQFLEEYYESGELWVKFFPATDTKEAETIYYYKSGKLLGREIEKEYLEYYETGELKTEIKYTYQDEKKREDVKKYYKTGELEETYSILNQDKIGPYIIYYKNGNIKEKRDNYKENKLDGYVTKYYEDGTLKSKEFFENRGRMNDSLLDGEALYYYPNGKLKEKKIYINILKKYADYSFTPLHIQNEKGTFLKEHTKYDENSKEIFHETYEVKDEYKEYYYKKSFFEKLKDKFSDTKKRVDNKKEIVRTYYDNGNLQLECPTLNGLQHGLCKYYAEDGWLLETQAYERGIKKGEKVKYNPDGTVRRITNSQ
jgi:antitoxin component YwqK of YwqJK toxin-antitoxin module